ncbi:hypothetical protein FEF22_001000 [Texas Phoenix palm phytoplasma]|uniref:Uncharacterized protein n=1 Tax=Texas Phoenix palm phytoplasma TaxID=176709 RepID=A0ABS5BJ21_9MOLU|nr:hypothetical protein [Texas Phoenix palm phytoplasma]MBP3059366.1 hypothetical protein [Texas Phoenix palm phytoplasma]
MNKKKLILSIFLSVFFVFLFFLIIWFCFLSSDNSNNNKNKILKIATALPTVKDFLEGPVREELKKENIDLEISFLPHQYKQTNELLNNDSVIAKLDSHLPYTFVLNQNNSQEKSTEEKSSVAQSFYWANLGLFNTKNNPNKIKTWEDLQKKLDSKEKIKILFCKEVPQQALALRFLEKLSLIQRKPQFNDQKLNLSQKINLKEEYFIISSNIELHKANSLTEIFNKFKDVSSDYDLFINYPAVVGINTLKKDVNYISKLELDENQTNLYVYTISLITKFKNLDSELINSLKKVLKKPELINQYQNKYSNFLSMISSDKNDLITEKINEYFEVIDNK